ncbi:aspartate-semialdehyde dehydrogenase [Gemmatirosa kalamazoonensis]|uniref:Aspartate-semialdehyde dehydrogenase n=1 Tax=Gemmatirosa kalamazoonensis TaxID=861299 RepID=W0RIN3_9BACT|nr:aspartate-semialdehyde dehydrogenase [Gemmatirosa kalamazoonensis]AHG90964.1 aspartate-semialdehyde dehydrogenase [Gemmatirosa kalamazoonensis]
MPRPTPHVPPLASLVPTGESFSRWPVAILGATGAVGQTFARLLADHPWFEVVELAASERSAGKRYAEVTRWIEGVMPDALRDREVLPCDPSAVRSTIVFSALDSSAAGTIEPAFAAAGKLVFSNAKNFRMAPDVPLVVPEINGDHLAIVEAQRRARGWDGAIVTNANCSVTVASLPLAPLHEAFGLSKAFLATMQAVSGAGYPGVPSLDILGNVIPYIADEEPKVETELQKILGRVDGERIAHAPFVVTAHTNRVPVEHGHTVCMSLGFERRPSVDEVLEVLREWRGSELTRDMPSAPERPIVVSDAPDRPQPRRDVMAGDGMSVTVGRVRADHLLDIRLVASGHNTIRGAAGGSILNAEIALGAPSRAHGAVAAAALAG